MPRQSPATATATESAAHTEDTVATLGATGPMEAIMARGRLSLLLLPRLKPIPTMALTDTVDFPMVAMDDLMVSLPTVATDAPTEDMVATDVATTERGRLRLLMDTDVDFPTEATDVLTEATDFLMVATDALTVDTVDMVATDVATTARGRLRLLLRLRLLMDTAMVAATEATEAMEATAAPMEDTVATGPMAAMVALTGMATESRQQLEHRHHMNKPKLLNMNWTKYKFSLILL